MPHSFPPTPDFRSLFESVPRLYLVLSANFTVVATSRAALLILKKNRQEVQERPVLELFSAHFAALDEKTIAEMRSSWTKVWQEKVPDTVTWRHNGPESQTITHSRENGWDFVHSPVFDPENRVIFILQEWVSRPLDAQTTDVSPDLARQFQNELKNSQERLDFVMDVAKLGEWDLNLANGTSSRSLRYARIFGYETLEMEWTFERFLWHVVPEDRDVINAKFQDAIARGEAWEFETRILRADGEVRAIWGRGRLWHDADGQPSRLLGTVADITPGKEAEAALRASEMHKSSILQSSLDAIVTMDHAGIVSEWNPAAERIFGYEREFALGQPLSQLIIPPALREQHRQGLSHYLKTGEGPLLNRRLEVTSIRSDGSEFFAELTITRHSSEGPPVFSGYIRDITQSKFDAESLLERTRLAELSADVGRILTRNDHLPEMLRGCAQAMVQHFDAAFARIWTLNSREQVLELQASAGLYTHLDGPHGRVPVGKFKIGRIAQNRTPHLTNNVIGDLEIADQDWARREKMVAFAGYPLIVEDRLMGVIAVFARKLLTQATLQSLASIADSIALGIERKWGEDARAQLLQSEKQARQDAENTNRIKDEFLSTLSHELRTPLQAILGWAYILRNNELDQAGADRALETIERNSRAQVQLVEDLLDVSRIITGKLRLNMAPLDLSTLISDAVEAVRPAAQAKQIGLQVGLDPQCGAISGDATRLQQVFWNLLTNAVKFTPPHGKIEVRLEQLDSCVQITVSDTGKGIDSHFLPHIFDRFRQADQTNTREHGGLGLGLSIVHHLVELHGGTITATSEGPGRGSTFIVQLPQIRAGATQTPSKPIISPEEAPNAAIFAGANDCSLPQLRGLRGLRVLVVDDEADTRDLLSAVLKRGGCLVTAATSAAEALELFQRTPPEVIVSDIGMPHEDGYTFIGQVRALETEKSGRVPAIALTAYARTEDRIQALRAGFQVHLSKPVDPAELVEVVASLVVSKKPEEKNPNG